MPGNLEEKFQTLHEIVRAARMNLRVQDVDFASNQIVVRGGKGDKDRRTMLPAVVKANLARHLELVRDQHRRDLQHGAGWVELPTALARKYANDGREWAWQGLSLAPTGEEENGPGWRSPARRRAAAAVGATPGRLAHGPRKGCGASR